MEKSAIRRAVKEVRKTMRGKHALWSKTIAEMLLSSPRFLSYCTYFIYIGTEDEVWTKDLIAALLLRGKRVFAPRTEPEGIAAVEIFSDTVYRKGAFGIEEPEGRASGEPIGLAVVPTVAFDPRGNRLGHGKGYYDRFLKDFRGAKLGLAFEYQKADAVPVEPFDVKMDAVLTERGVYPKSACPRYPRAFVAKSDVTESEFSGSESESRASDNLGGKSDLGGRDAGHCRKV